VILGRAKMRQVKSMIMIGERKSPEYPRLVPRRNPPTIGLIVCPTSIIVSRNPLKCRRTGLMQAPSSRQTGFGMMSKDDYETVANASPVYDAFYANCKLKLIREKHKAEMEKMDRKQRREFLRKKLVE
jgi:hypothetical protein